MEPIADSTDLEKELEKQISALEFGTVEVTPRKEFVSMLRHSLKTGTPLRVKCGIDPTRTDVHLGHFVPYRKMRAFQDFGHTGVVIVGDYTARIGDPSGRDATRPPLDEAQVKKNGEFYEEQLLKILDPNRTEFHYQSQWYEKTRLKDVLTWANQTTVAKLLGHETFAKRVEQGLVLGLHELFYPVLQGIDSVQVRANVELGGSDQKFNVLMGRDYQRNQGQPPQCAMLMPIITGIDGRQKMSSSLDNFIGIQDEPFDMFGKVMSTPDHLLAEYFHYLANLSPEELQRKQQALNEGIIHPNEAKKQLASLVVALFYDSDTAQKQREQFEKVFAQKKLPDSIPEYFFSQGKPF